MSANPTTVNEEEDLLKQQEEIFKKQIQRIRRLTSILATFDVILRRAKTFELLREDEKEEIVQKTEAEIRNAEKQLADIRKEQMDRFQALSKENQRRICNVEELEHFEHLYLKNDKIRPAVNQLQAFDNVNDLSKGGHIMENMDRRVELVDIVENKPQPHVMRASILRGEATTYHVHYQQGSPFGGATETLGVFMNPHGSPQSGQLSQQQRPVLFNEVRSQMSQRVSIALFASDAEIEEMLMWNRAMQLALASGLKSSERRMLEIQEDIRRTGDVEGEMMQRLDFEIEAFLRATEVKCGSGEEDNHGLEPIIKED